MEDNHRGIYKSGVTRLDPKTFLSDYEPVHTIRVVQAAVSIYDMCYRIQSINDEQVVLNMYSPESIRKMQVGEIEAKGQWYIQKR